MSRLLFVLPSVGAGDEVLITSDDAGTTPAQIVPSGGGGPITGSRLRADGAGKLPRVFGPNDGTATLYVASLNYRGAVTGTPVEVTGAASPDDGGQVPDQQIPSAIARDTEVAAAHGLPVAPTGATQPTRYVGRWAATGAPASGTFAVGDFGFDGTNAVQVCTVAGSPGTWVPAGGGTSGQVPVPSLDGDGHVVLTIPAGSVWGIDGDGFPYYDADGAAVGEEAMLVVGTDGTPVVTTIGVLAL